jgi:Leucine-rich repeat (LRR) protein
MNNYIEDFRQLVKFKNLKIINLKDNKIKDISKLDEFVKEFTELKRIIISKNKIDTKDEKNIKIIENIRNRNIQIDIL